MLLAFPFIAEHNRTSSLGALDETWLSQCKPKAGGVEGALTLYILKYISDLKSWESFFGNVSILPNGFTSNQKAFFWSILQDHSWKPIVHARIQESPWDWRHLGKAIYPEIGRSGGLKLRGNMSVDDHTPKCVIFLSCILKEIFE